MNVEHNYLDWLSTYYNRMTCSLDKVTINFRGESRMPAKQS